MADVTGVLNEALRKRNVAPIRRSNYSVGQIDGFLREAYTINSRIVELLTYVRAIRQPYLSTAPPPRRRLQEALNHNDHHPSYLTDKQRDEIDADAKAILRDLHAAVNVLSDAEKVRQQGDAALAEKRRKRHGLGALGKWAAGGALTERSAEEIAAEAKVNGIKAHREGVIWYLQQRLEQCGRMQSSMMRIRLDREVEKSKSILYKTRGSGPVPVWEDAMLADAASGSKGKAAQKGLPPQDSGNGADGDDHTSDEQMQLFAKENQAMLKHYENKLDQVRTAEKSILEIAELQSTIAQHLDVQSVMIDQLVQDSFTTTENVGTGNKELKKASEKRSLARLACYATAGACSFCIIFDLIF